MTFHLFERKMALKRAKETLKCLKVVQQFAVISTGLLIDNVHVNIGSSA
jgi:hypothetical protein